LPASSCEEATSPKILVINDDAMIRDLLSCTLEMEGHSVVAAENGIEGVARQRAELPNLTITDMIRPEQGGAKTISQILQATPDARIVAMSGGGSLNGTHPLTVAKKARRHRNSAQAILGEPSPPRTWALPETSRQDRLANSPAAIGRQY
jgi:CheY-like chemotaxis protein